MSVVHHQRYNGPGPVPFSAALPAAYSHAVNRSDELLSCARTILKLAKRKHPPTDNNDVPTSRPSHLQSWWSMPLNELRLYNLEDGAYQADASSSIYHSLEDAVDLLRGMDSELEILEGLVRRRGHTNDPTEDIKRSTQRLERDTQELQTTLHNLVPATARGQHQRHWQILVQWFQGAAQHQAHRLQQVLKTRGTVLAEQAQRRKLFSSSSSSTAATNSLSTSMTDSTTSNMANNPLFRMKAPPKAVPNQQPYPPATPMRMDRNGTSSNALSSNPTYDAHRQSTNHVAPRLSNPYQTASSSGFGASRGPGYGGRPLPTFPSTPTSTTNYYYYGSSSSNSNGPTTGIRQRRAMANAASHDDATASAEAQAHLLELRHQERQTQQRLHDARQAEQSLSELGTLFGKMTHLLSVQSEMIDKVEDDVEAAQLDVVAGHGEIQTLYSIKKGNRALILKVFGLLIFFIVFMRFYKSK